MSAFLSSYVLFFLQDFFILFCLIDAGAVPAQEREAEGEQGRIFRGVVLSGSLSLSLSSLWYSRGEKASGKVEYTQRRENRGVSGKG
jgi:hypothetical protein